MTQRRIDRHERDLRRYGSDLPSGLRRRQRQKRAARARRHRVMVLLMVLLVIVFIGAIIGAGFGGAAVAMRCTLSDLRPVSIGQNSFVYAANGVLLGSIPADKNRQPVSLNAFSA